jgi:PAS domain S-box-containing protein
MRSSRTHLFSVRLFFIAVGFGLTAMLVILAGFHLQIPGTKIVTDAREIFVLIGAALTGPIGGIIIGILAGLGDPNADVHLYIIANHVVGAVWVGWAYKRLVHDRIHMPWMLLGWVGVVFVYYFVCLIPVVVVAKYMFPEFFLNILPEPHSFVQTLLVFYRGWLVEFILTTVLTSSVLLVLPRAARSPMWWTGTHPRVVASFRERPARNILALRLTLWFLILSCGPLVIMGLFLRNTLTQLYMEQIAKDELAVMNVLVGSIKSEDELEELVRSHRLTLADSLHGQFILNGEGRLVWHADSALLYADARGVYSVPVVEEILRYPRGSVYDETNSRCFLFTRLKDSPHWLVVVLDVDVSTAMLKMFERRTLVRLGMALVLVSGIAGLVIWLIIGRPIRSLAHAARRVGRNDLQARVNPKMMSDEVGILGEAFNEMTENLAILHRGLQSEIEERRSTERALRASERRFREMSDLLPQTVFELDLSGRFVFANRAAYAMFGFDPAQPAGGFSLLEHVAPEERDRLLTATHQFSEGTGSTGNEHMFKRADGSMFPGLVYWAAVRDGDRPSGMRGIIVDISEVRRVQEVLQKSVTEKELMLKEIHHRVKNNLQIVSSLLNLQASSIRDPVDLALFEESVDRIRSMALIHDRLYKSHDLAGIEFREYIESLVMSLFHLYGHPNIDFRAEVQDVRLSIDTAIPCGLIINELVTNALKHAFPGRRRGIITVSLATRANGDVELCVADDGVGIPEDVDARNTTSLGLQLVNILTGQLTATLEIRRGNGTTFSILVPRLPEPRKRPEAPVSGGGPR